VNPISWGSVVAPSNRRRQGAVSGEILDLEPGEATNG
jgi:hypothetical protein